MRELRSDEARRGFRDLLDEVERDPAAAIRILRYERPVAVVVSADWHDRVLAFLVELDDLHDLAGLDGDRDELRALERSARALRTSVTTEPGQDAKEN